jgi:hypothetical protein
MTGTVHQNRDYPKFEKNVREDMDYFIISDESMFWSCLFVLLPSLSYCYSLSKTKPVLQGYSREKNLGFEFSNRSRSYPIASSPGGKIPVLRVISQQKYTYPCLYESERILKTNGHLHLFNLKSQGCMITSIWL